MTTDARSSISVHGLTVVTTCSAGAALASAIAVNSANVAPVVITWGVVIVATVIAAIFFRRLAHRWPTVPAVVPVFLILAISPYVWEAIQRVAWGTGLPMEVVLLTSVQLAAFSMSAASCWATFQPLTMVSALFVTLFSASISQDPSTRVAAGLFAVCGLSWLITAHWSMLATRMTVSHRHRNPQSSFLIPLTVTLAVSVTFGLLRSDRLWALAGFMPSSGGDGRQDASANRGIGDGESLVAGEEDIQSFGPIEDAPFRASEDPSLYDLFNDLYEEPVKVKNQKRAIALPADLKQQLESRMSKSERAGKEFSTARKQRDRAAGEMSHLTSDALLYVKGRVPLHLRQELFDLFDNTTWYAEDVGGEHPTLKLENEGERPWLCWPELSQLFDAFGPVENHALKIVHLKSNRVPAPLHFRGLHIDRLDRPDFFRAIGDHLLQMDLETLPELTSIQVRSQTVERGKIDSRLCWGLSRESNYLVLPEGAESERIRALAEYGLKFSEFVNWAIFAPEGEPIPNGSGTQWQEACRHVVNSMSPVICGKCDAARGLR